MNRFASLACLVALALGCDPSPVEDSGTPDTGTPRDSSVADTTVTMDSAIDSAMPDARDSGPPMMVEAVINEAVLNHAGLDMNEYVEFLAPPSEDLRALTILFVEGDIDATGNSPGTIDAFVPLGVADASGIYLAPPFVADTLENGSMTLLLVQGFTGTGLLDLDTDDDGVTEMEPWDAIIDAVAIDDGDTGDVFYAGGAVISRGFDGVDETPGGISRLPNGVDTDSPDDWTRNDFDGAGIPGLDPGTPTATEALNTPGEPNALAVTPPADVLINEIVVNHFGADTDEFLEVRGSPSTDYSSLAIVILEGDIPNFGLVDGVFPLGTTDANGYWRTDFSSDVLENGTATYLLVQYFAGFPGWDLDMDDDGALDGEPWTARVDSFAIRDEDEPGDRTFDPVVLAPTFDGVGLTVGGISRIPDGTDTDSVDDWTRNDFDGDGLPSFPSATASSGEAVNTPGAANEVAP